MSPLLLYSLVAITGFIEEKLEYGLPIVVMNYFALFADTPDKFLTCSVLFFQNGGGTEVQLCLLHHCALEKGGCPPKSINLAM
jgi:hypothetical protein